MASIITTLGPMAADQLGDVLPHEHVFVDLRTWDQPGYAEADAVAVVALMAPEIERARDVGVTAIVECSTVGVGRRADILRAVSEATGFPLVVPTGIYREPWVPPWAHEASEDELNDWMLRELTDEISGTGVQAGWIKLSAGDDGLTPSETKILRAAARAAKTTGSVIGSHTIRGAVVRDQLDILEDVGLAADRFIWIHTQAEPDASLHLAIARRGAWIEYDAIGSDDHDDAFFLERIGRVLDAGLEGRLLLSQDRGSYDPAQPDGGTPRPYTYLSETFLPQLRATGLREAEIQGLMRTNPFEAFARQLS
jgi:phosphotriesterase-related protein